MVRLLMMKGSLIQILIIVIGILFCSIKIFPQDISSIAFINELADRDEVTFAQAVRLFVLTMGKKSQSFKRDLRILEKEGILENITLKKDALIRKGDLSLMIAKYLNLADTLMFKIFKTGRYAHRACVANGIMQHNGSEWDKLSGGEIIEIMTKVLEKYEESR